MVAAMPLLLLLTNCAMKALSENRISVKTAPSEIAAASSLIV